MKNVIVAGVVALALVGCSKKEEVVAPEAAPVVEASAEAPAAEVASVEAAPEAAAEVAPVEAAQ